MAITLDLFEYSTDALAQAEYVSSSDPASWDLLDEDCSDITDWTDSDVGNGVSEVSPAGQFHFYVSPAASGSYAYRARDFGSYPSTYTVEIKIYHDVLGTVADTNYAQFEFHKVDFRFQFRLATDGLFVHDGAAWNEVGTDLVQTGVWQTWRFLVTGTTPASATVDVYLNDTLKASGVDCSNTGTFTDGKVDVLQFGYTVATENHIDYIKIATGLYPPDLQCYSEATIKQQGSYSLKGIAVVTNSLNDTLTRTVSPTIDLSNQTWIKFDIYSSRTGSNVKIGIRDSGGVITEITPNIISANTWQTVNWDISAVANVDKDAINQIKITIVNADA